LYDIIHTKTFKFPLKNRVDIALDIAITMNYLHSRKMVILHRDLKSENVLILKNFKVKLCDFGISKMVESDTEEFDLETPLNISKQTKTIGTVSWMSPEFINDKISSKKSDVYSFGILLWELMTRAKLYPDLQPIQIAYGVANSNLRPEIPPGMNKSIAELIIK
jgi:serine/threonine protein kinase